MQRMRAAAVQAAVRISDAAVSLKSKTPISAAGADLPLHPATNGHTLHEEDPPKPPKARKTSQPSSSGKPKAVRTLPAEPEEPAVQVFKSAWRPPAPRPAPPNLLKDAAVEASTPSLALDEQFVAGVVLFLLAASPLRWTELTGAAWCDAWICRRMGPPDGSMLVSSVMCSGRHRPGRIALWLRRGRLVWRAQPYETACGHHPTVY